MDVKKIVLDDNVYDVREFIEIQLNPTILDYHTAVIVGNGYVYPYRNSRSNKPGFYSMGCMYQFIHPTTPEELQMYSETNIIDFSSASNFKDIMRMNAHLNEQEKTMLESGENIFYEEITPKHTPHMSALLDAINCKQIDIDKYESRFNNFNNDKRLLRKDDITINKLLMFVNNLDMSATLTIRDRSPNVPNPIGKEIVVDLISSDEE